MKDDFQVNLKEFNDAIRDFATVEVPEKVTAMQRKIVLTALRKIVLKTPVDTGYARMNWQVTINKPADSVVGEQSGEKVRSSRVYEKANAVLANLPPFQTVYISNNVDYIEFLEEGSSKQAPAGMVAITVEELKGMFK